jgi:hypothetical protein
LYPLRFGDWDYEWILPEYDAVVGLALFPLF